ncbi:hypothetical protein Tco_1281316 [Tanacetum coccineum]
MNNIRSMRMTDIVNALQQGASDNTREGFRLIFNEFLSRPVVVSQLATSSHGGGLAHSHGYNPFGPPLGGDSRGFTGFYHQFQRPLHGGGRGFMPLLYDNQYGPPCGPMATEASSFQPLGSWEQVDAAAPLVDFPPPEENK